MIHISSELLTKIKKTKLVGELGLTHKPVIDHIELFSNRPEAFLDELRRLRETMAFKPGPSKRRIANQGSEGEEGGDDSEVREGAESGSSGPRTNKKNQSTSKSAAADAAKLSTSSLSLSEQANLLAALNVACGPKKRKKNG